MKHSHNFNKINVKKVSKWMHTLYICSTTVFVYNIKMFKKVSPISLRGHLEQLALISTYSITEPCGVINL